MSPLRFPPNALEILEDGGPPSEECTTEFTKWLIYVLDGVPQEEAKELYLAAKKADEIAKTEAEWELIHYLRPAEQDFTAPDVQHVLDRHFLMVEEMLAKYRSTGEYDWELYRDGFMVITQADWRERGVTAVHCDWERKKWKVTQCNNIPVEELSDLNSVQMGDQSFEQVCHWYDDSGNDGPDNQGGPVPAGEWQFVVYCTSPSEWKTLHYAAELKIPDPRKDGSMGQGEECLCILWEDLPAERVNEDWPLAYANLIKNTKVYPSPCKRHPELFVHIRGGLDNIEIVKMEWDHNIERDDEDLMRIGRESKTTVQKCDAESLVSTLEQLANED